VQKFGLNPGKSPLIQIDEWLRSRDLPELLHADAMESSQRQRDDRTGADKVKMMKRLLGGENGWQFFQVCCSQYSLEWNATKYCS
jgi:hypothetical protein